MPVSYPDSAPAVNFAVPPFRGSLHEAASYKVIHPRPLPELVPPIVEFAAKYAAFVAAQEDSGSSVAATLTPTQVPSAEERRETAVALCDLGVHLRLGIDPARTAPSFSTLPTPWKTFGSVFLAALRLDGTCSRAWANFGTAIGIAKQIAALGPDGREVSPFECYAKALELDNENAAAWTNLASVLVVDNMDSPDGEASPHENTGRHLPHTHGAVECPMTAAAADRHLPCGLNLVGGRDAAQLLSKKTKNAKMKALEVAVPGEEKPRIAFEADLIRRGLECDEFRLMGWITLAVFLNREWKRLCRYIDDALTASIRKTLTQSAGPGGNELELSEYFQISVPLELEAVAKKRMLRPSLLINGVEWTEAMAWGRVMELHSLFDEPRASYRRYHQVAAALCGRDTLSFSSGAEVSAAQSESAGHVTRSPFEDVCLSRLEASVMGAVRCNDADSWLQLAATADEAATMACVKGGDSAAHVAGKIDLSEPRSSDTGSVSAARCEFSAYNAKVAVEMPMALLRDPEAEPPLSGPTKSMEMSPAECCAKALEKDVSNRPLWMLLTKMMQKQQALEVEGRKFKATHIKDMPLTVTVRGSTVDTMTATIFERQPPETTEQFVLVASKISAMKQRGDGKLFQSEAEAAEYEAAGRHDDAPSAPTRMPEAAPVQPPRYRAHPSQRPQEGDDFSPALAMLGILGAVAAVGVAAFAMAKLQRR